MDLLAAWLLFPLVSLLVCWGIGLLAERVGRPLPGVLLLPVGMAGLICATQLTTYADWSAELTLPLVLALALAGFVLGRARLRPRPDPWAVAAIVGVFMVFAAPVVLSGQATFAGYTVLGDTSIHMIGADALLKHGRDFSSLPPSSYEYSLVVYYGASGYPSGGPTAVGTLTSLVHQDVAWTFQPFLALLVALMAAQLWSLLTPLVTSKPLRALLTFVSAQPGLVLAYALQGSVKEVGTAWGVVLVAALIPVYAGARAGPRRAVPLALASGALVGVVGLAAAVWLGPLLLIALVAGAIAQRPRPVVLLIEAVGFCVVLALLGYQSLIDLTKYVESAGGVVTAQEEFGNLLGPLDPLHVLGVWLSGDYRIPPVSGNLDASNVLSGVVAGAFAIGLIGALVRRSWPSLAFVGVSLFAYAYVTSKGSPWADGKAMMIVSPAIMFGAATGVAFLYWLERRLLAWGLAAVLAVAVLWTNALQYHDASLAPRDRMEELADLGERLDGQGPTLYSEFEEFGKHFLRNAAPEGSSEGWQRRYDLTTGRAGQPPHFGVANDIDQYTDRYLSHYRTIVLRRGFFGSRPPSTYRRIHHGRYYDVWQRPAGAERRLIRHDSLGDRRQPGAAAPCERVRAIARDARREGGRIAYAEMPQVGMFIPSHTAIPRGWIADTSDGFALQARGPGRIQDSIVVRRAGRYGLWVEGSLRRDWRVLVDGRETGTLRKSLNPRLSAVEVAQLDLRPGRHVIALVRPGGSLAPGDGGFDLLGPVALAPEESDDRPAATIAPSDYRSLCNRSLDWVEAVR